MTQFQFQFQFSAGAGNHIPILSSERQHQSATAVQHRPVRDLFMIDLRPISAPRHPRLATRSAVARPTVFPVFFPETLPFFLTFCFLQYLFV